MCLPKRQESIIEMLERNSDFQSWLSIQEDLAINEMEGEDEEEIGQIDDADERVQEAREKIKRERMFTPPPFVEDDDWETV